MPERSDLPQGTLDLLILQVVAAGAIHGYGCGFRKFWRINSGNSDHLAVRYSGRLSRCLRRGGVVKSQVLGPHRRTIQREETTALQDAVDDRVGEVFVMQYASPLVERFVGGEDHRALLPMAIVDDMEEHVCSIGPVGEVPHFVDHNDRGMDISGERVGELPTTKCGRKVVDEFSGGDKQRVKSILNRSDSVLPS